MNIVILIIIIILAILIYSYVKIHNYFSNKSFAEKRSIKAIERVPRLKTLLRIIDKIFKENNIEYWADFGTLLGIIRDGDIVCHDYDCDISTLSTNYDKIHHLLQMFVKNNPKYKIFVFHLFNIKFISLSEREPNIKLGIDIFFYQRKNDSMTICIPPFWQKYCLNMEARTYQFYDFFPLLNKKLDNLDIPIPNKYPNVLSLSYGNNFMVPDRYHTQDCIDYRNSRNNKNK